MEIILDLGIAVGIVIMAAGSYVTYAGIIKARNKVQEALADIDVQFTRRHDLIPNILKCASEFMAHETALMTGITTIRTEAQAGIGSRAPAGVGEHLQNEAQLQGLMSRFFAVAESYPQLKSDQTMLQASSGGVLRCGRSPRRRAPLLQRCGRSTQ